MSDIVARFYGGPKDGELVSLESAPFELYFPKVPESSIIDYAHEIGHPSAANRMWNVETYRRKERVGRRVNYVWEAWIDA